MIGQHPEAQGSFGELLVVSEGMARAVPDGVPNDAVALVDAFAVGEFYVRSSRIEPGEIPIVVGAGAIGLSAVAALAARGIEPIVVSDCKPERLELAPSVRRARAREPRRAARRSTSGGRSQQERMVTTPAVVFECVGAPGIDPAASSSSATCGRASTPPGAGTPATRSIARRPRTRASPIQFGGGPHPEDWYGTLDAICAGRLDPLPAVGEIIGLDEVPAALDRARRSDGPPRIVVHPNATPSV